MKLKNYVVIDVGGLGYKIFMPENNINEIKKANVYTVFGCTGDRDRTKRPIMMSLATNNSKYVITNPEDYKGQFQKIFNNENI